MGLPPTPTNRLKRDRTSSDIAQDMRLLLHVRTPKSAAHEIGTKDRTPTPSANMSSSPQDGSSYPSSGTAIPAKRVAASSPTPGTYCLWTHRMAPSRMSKPCLWLLASKHR